MADDLLNSVERFLLAENMSASRFGRWALNDSRLVKDMRERGRQLRPEAEERVRAFMRSYRRARQAGREFGDDG